MFFKKRKNQGNALWKQIGEETLQQIKAMPTEQADLSSFALSERIQILKTHASSSEEREQAVQLEQMFLEKVREQEESAERVLLLEAFEDFNSFTSFGGFFC